MDGHKLTPLCHLLPKSQRALRLVQTASHKLLLLTVPLSLPLLLPLSKPNRDERIPVEWEGHEIEEGTSSKQPKEKRLYLAHLGKYFPNLLLSSGDRDTALFPSDLTQAIPMPWLIRSYLLSFLETTQNFQWCCWRQSMTFDAQQTQRTAFFISLLFAVTFYMFEVCCPIPQSSLVFRLNKT